MGDKEIAEKGGLVVKKRILCVATAIVCLGMFAGCKDQKQINANEKTTMAQEKFKVTQNEVTEGKISECAQLVFEDDTMDDAGRMTGTLTVSEEKALAYGNVFQLQKKDGDKWYAYDNNELVSLEGKLLGMGESCQIDYDLSNYELQQGEYRIEISVHELNKEQYENHGEEGTEGEERVVYAYFDVE